MRCAGEWSPYELSGIGFLAVGSSSASAKVSGAEAMTSPNPFVESFNVQNNDRAGHGALQRRVAGAVALYEVARQRAAR